MIKERRTQRPEARAAARSAAVKEAKDKKAAADSAKKADKAKNAASAARGNTGRRKLGPTLTGGARKRQVSPGSTPETVSAGSGNAAIGKVYGVKWDLRKYYETAGK